ncbi:MAG TPA: hypothetical protein VKX17_09285 [Planctomycetota bacterium]|nr:hypothetical protein [Planctomycetota bacterium]
MREFFREKRVEFDSNPTNWRKKKDAWLKSVRQFYNQIQIYLNAAIKDGSVKIEYRPIQISEDYVGGYQVDELVLSVGNEKVVFTPKGMNIVGAQGRIDLRGDMKTMTIIREPAGHWSIVATRVPERTVLPLSEESLLAALKSVMRK